MNAVWITAWGALTPIGSDRETISKALRLGRSGLVARPEWAALGMTCQVGGGDLALPDGASLRPEWAAVDDPHVRFGLLAAEQALANTPVDRGMHLMATTGLGVCGHTPAWSGRAGRPGNWSLLAEAVADRFELEGRVLGLSTACTTGLEGLGEAFRWIRDGEAEQVLVVASQALFPEMAAFFDAWEAMPHSYNNNPARAARPFDQAREGFVIAPGAAAVLLESTGAIRSRSRRPLARVVGFSAHNDGYSLSEPNGRGLTLSVREALEQADLGLADIDLIAPHGSGTAVGDLRELNTLIKVGREGGGVGTPPPWITSTKSLHGHSMGATGLVETVMALLMLEEGFVSPLPNLQQPMRELSAFRWATEPTGPVPLRRVLCCNAGLGGANGCVILEGPAPQDRRGEST